MSVRSQATSRGRDEKEGAVKSRKAEKYFDPVSSMKEIKHTYEEVVDQVVLSVAEALSVSTLNPEDVEASIKSLQKVDLTMHKPTIGFSTDADPDKKAAENRAHDMTFTTANKAYAIRVSQLDRNLHLARTIILKYFVSEDMDAKLRDEADFESTLKDTIELLKRIKTFMETSQDGKYEPWGLLELLLKWHACKQGAKETMNSYKQRFAALNDKVKRECGTDCFIAFIKRTEAYTSLTDAAAKTAMEKASFEIISTALFAKNSDLKRTGALIQRLRERMSQGFDEYPKTMEEAQRVLNEFMELLPSEETMSFVQSGGKKPKPLCYVCGSYHRGLAQKCKHRYKDKDDWFDKSKYVDYKEEEAKEEAKKKEKEAVTLLQASDGTIDPGSIVRIAAPTSGAGTGGVDTPLLQMGAGLAPAPAPGTQLMQIPNGTGVARVRNADGTFSYFSYHQAAGLTQWS